jgi:hypothetical protein
VTLDGLLRIAAVRLAHARAGSAMLVRAQVRALRGALALVLLRRRLPGALAALAAAGPTGAPDRAGSDRILASLSRLPTTCLWRALAGYAALRARNEPVRFVLGVRTESGDVIAHAWLERDGVPLAQADDPRARFQPAFVHPAPEPGAPSERPMPDPSDVILTELEDGTGVLLHLGTKFYYTLNRTGVAVWRRLAEGVTDPGALARELAAAFEGVGEEQARADVDSLLSELCAEGLAPAPA